MAVDTIRATSVGLDEAPAWSLANGFWLLAHDSVGAVLRLHETAHATGLAACLLGELWLEGRVRIDEGHLSVIDRRPAAPEPLPDQPPTPSLLDWVWAQIAAEPWRHKVRPWLTTLGQTADQQVTARLAATGQVRVEGSRRSTRVVPSSPNLTGIPTARLRTCLLHRRMSAQDQVLLALVDAVGLNGPVFEGLAEPMRDYHPWLLGQIRREYPPIAELANQTKSLVAAATLTRGRG
jgi:hypothetical protein